MSACYDSLNYSDLTSAEGTFPPQTCCRPDGLGLSMFDGNELCQDADGDFLRRHRSNVLPDWRVDQAELGRRQPLFEERVKDSLHLRPTANQPEIAKLSRGKHTQGVEVVAMPA